MSPPDSPSQESRSRVMQQQEERLQQSLLRRKQAGSATKASKPLSGRPLLLGARNKTRTYWDSSQEGAFDSSKKPHNSPHHSEQEKLTIIGQIQRTKYHSVPDFEFQDATANPPLLKSMKTERCLLRPINISSNAEIRLLQELFSDVESSRNIPAPLNTNTLVDTEEKAIALVKKSQNEAQQTGTSLLTIADKTAGVLLGVAGIWPIHVYKASKGRVDPNEPFNPDTMEESFEIAFALVQAAWGKGLATESVLALNHLADRLSLDKSKIFAYVDGKQCKSQHVLEKIGMKRQEGTVKYRGEEGIVRFAFEK